MRAFKQAAAAKALELVQPGMKLGLGTGSTAAEFIELLGARVAAGLNVRCVPTSEATRAQAASLGIPLTTLDDTPDLDITVDGADEIDTELRLIKGGGGALLREKIVAMASERFIVIADASKKVERLGAFPLPIEVAQFGLRATQNMIEAAAEDAGVLGNLTLRRNADGSPFVTDNGNFILDGAFGAIEDPDILADVLEMIPGVVEHGLFIGLADTVIIGGENGVEMFQAPEMSE